MFQRDRHVSINWDELPEGNIRVRKLFEHEQPIYCTAMSGFHIIRNSKGVKIPIDEEHLLPEFIPNNSYVEYLQHTQRSEMQHFMGGTGGIGFEAGRQMGLTEWHETMMKLYGSRGYRPGSMQQKVVLPRVGFSSLHAHAYLSATDTVQNPCQEFIHEGWFETEMEVVQRESKRY